MDEPRVTIVMRSYNEAWALRETLPALHAQDYRAWDLIAFDSGSDDGSLELLRATRPRHLVTLLPEDYNPARVLNAGAELATTEAVIFLNADATPQGSGWLRPLVAALQDPGTAAVFGRQVPRPGCAAAFAHDYARCFGPEGPPPAWGPFFSMVSSGLRRSIWERRGFRETMQYSEDDEYARWCRAQGHRVAYCPGSVVMHSHNYTPAQAYKRSFGEAWALAAVWEGPSPTPAQRTRVAVGWLRDAVRDAAFCLRNGRAREWPSALRIRWAQRCGRRAGFLAGWPMHRLEACA